MTNRRAFLSSLTGLVVGGAAAMVATREAKTESQSVVITVRSNDGHIVKVLNADSDKTCECMPELAENLAREIMSDTGEWKESILRTRSKDRPMLATRYGCCGCEVSLASGAHHPDWTYKVRPLTSAERSSFRQEYGNMAGYLLHTGPSDSRFEYRGFILNGRREGWNVSIRTLGPKHKRPTLECLGSEAEAVSGQRII